MSKKTQERNDAEQGMQIINTDADSAFARDEEPASRVSEIRSSLEDIGGTPDQAKTHATEPQKANNGVRTFVLYGELESRELHAFSDENMNMVTVIHVEE